MAVLEYGLTVKGKPLRDHQDVVAHARGVDFIQSLLGRGRIKEADVLPIHRIVITEQSNDIYRPVGKWKREDNGTYGAEGGKSVYMPYASAHETPVLMAKWLESFNAMFGRRADERSALDSYVAAHVSFVRIHPFFDGNGRIARLLANLPVLYAGFPPIVIPAEARLEYISELWAYQRAVGVITASHPALLPDEERLDGFKTLVRGWWSETISLVDEAKRSMACDR